MHLRGWGNLCSSAVYNQGQLILIYTHFVRLKINLIRQAHNRLLEKANENVANQRKHKFFKRWRHEIRHSGPPVKIAVGPPTLSGSVLVTCIFALLVKSLQWNRKIQCGNTCRRHFIRTIWYSLPFYLVWKRRSHTSFFSTTPLLRGAHRNFLRGGLKFWAKYFALA